MLRLLVYYHGLGSAICWVCIAWKCRGQPQATHALRLLMAGSIVPLLVLASRSFLMLSANLNPVTFDAELVHFEMSLGIQPGAALSQSISAYPVLAELGRLVYASLPMMTVWLWAVQMQTHSTTSLRPTVLPTFLWIALLGFPIYFLYPATGPGYVLIDVAATSAAGWPPHTPPVVVAGAPRNAMPSLHAAWALALWFGSRPLGYRIRRASDAFLALTLWATLALGEHYLVDLVVAVPLVLVALALAHARRGVDRALWAGLFAMAGWLIYLRFGAHQFAQAGPLHWLPMGLTVGWCLAASLRIERQSRTTPHASTATCGNG